MRQKYKFFISPPWPGQNSRPCLSTSPRISSTQSCRQRQKNVSLPQAARRNSWARTPSTAQNTKKQRFTIGKSLLFLQIGTETGQNEGFV